MFRRDGAPSGTRTLAAATVAVAVMAVLAGCSVLEPKELPTPHSSHGSHALGVATDSPSASGASDGGDTTGGNGTPRARTSPSQTTAPDPAQSHLATVEPQAAPSPAPTISPIPTGTVVAQGDVASPKGSIHFHYEMVTNSDGTYSAQYSGFTSTVPIPIGVTLLDIPPRVGDGLTYHGVGDHQLGGPTTTAAAASTAALGTTQPGYLTSLVTYSAATSAGSLPVELRPGKVLAVTTLRWSIPVRQTNVHPVDHGSRQFAAGTVTERTAAGGPKHYVVASGDTTAMVAARFGISVQDLIWLNAGLEVFGDQQYLYSGTTINLDPQSR
jgi:hypothetical protein